MSNWSVIANTPDKVGESPVWSVAEQSLYWVDIEGRAIRRYRADQAGQALQSWHLSERVGCIALCGQASVVAAMESGIAKIGLGQDGKVDLQWLARTPHSAHGMRFNDGRCDATGRLWVGTMVMDMSLASAQGGLYCLDERGLTGPYVSGLITPNGLGFSPDGKTMYLSDSHPSVQKIWAFDFNAQTGQPSNRRLFADMQPLPGRPDGAAVDASGNYWICGNDAGQIHCFAPDGRLVQSQSVPMSKPSMCAFGGPDLKTLFVTSIVPAKPSPSGLDGAVIAGQPFVLPSGSQPAGLPEPVFSRFPQAAMHG
jgi:sugar lactone lactonase YvrE